MQADNKAIAIEPASGPARGRRIMMVAGEASGDMHGGDLAAAILARDPGCELFGVAGNGMRTAGVRALFNAEDLAGLGITETASARRIVRAFMALRASLRRDPPALVILIDFAEFNMMLAGVARRAGVPVLYYITPQVWAWRRGRIRKLIKRADRLAVILPFEAKLYSAAEERVTFVGHPLLDRVRPAQDRAATLKRHGIRPGSRLVAILPGSRRGEVRYLLRPMIGAARVLARDHGLELVLALAPTLTPAELQREGRADLDGIRVIEGDTYSIIAASDVALVTSGTATLETALLGCPMVIAYKTSVMTHAVGRLLVTGVDYIGMPNILAGRQIVPELIQRDVTISNVVRAAEPLLTPAIRNETVAALKSLRASLGEPGAAARVARIALEMIA